MFRSTNKGANWTRIVIPGLDPFLDVLSLGINSKGHVFAGIDGAVFRSTDNGDVWQRLDVPLTANLVRTIMTTANGHVYIGTHDVFAAYGGITRSLDNGDTWSRTGLNNRPVFALGANTLGDVFAGTYNAGIIHSSDQGESWALIGAPASDVYGLAFNSCGHIFAVTAGGVYRSIDDGKNWTLLNAGFGIFRSLAINSRGEIFVGTHYAGGVLRSADNGETWKSAGNFLPYPFEVPSLAVNSEDHIFVGTNEGVFRSTDDGDHWLRVLNHYVRCFVFNSKGQIFAGTFGQGVFRSMDEGESWTVTALTDAEVYDLTINSKGHLFAATWGRGILQSTDNGDSWRPIKINNGLFDNYILAIAINSNDEIFASTYEEFYSGRRMGNIFYSSDNGINWTEFNTGSDSYAYSLIIDANGYIFAGTENYGVFRSVQSTTPNKNLSMKYFLKQNYPNPFNSSTKIGFSLPYPGLVTLKVYDTLGREIATILQGEHCDYQHEVEWNAAGFASGVYFYRLRAGDFLQTRKLTILR